MKFTVAVLLALFAVSSQGSAIYPYGAWPYASHWTHAAPITQYSSYPAVAFPHAAPISYAAHVAAPHAYAVASPHGWPVAAPHAIVAHEATYTAANRGSVHTAPLPGHAASQTSLNLAPAPGTH